MATLAENITEMAALTANLKKNYRLSENTILRLIDMNLAIQSQPGRFGQPDMDDSPVPLPPTDEELAAMLGISPTTEDEVIEGEATEITETPEEEPTNG
jgi:hypothetical protein